MELILSKPSGDGFNDLRIRCMNLSDINIGHIEGMFGLLVDIENVRSRQLESAVYKVTELEENAFSFYCEEFFFELI